MLPVEMAFTSIDWLLSTHLMVDGSLNTESFLRGLPPMVMVGVVSDIILNFSASAGKRVMRAMRRKSRRFIAFGRAGGAGYK